MARSSAIAVENNFSKGLITETTALKFPPNACTETYDCVFDSTGRVTRRPGFDLESDYVLQTVTKEADEVFVEFLWKAVAGIGTMNFVVQQQGSSLFFYDVSSDLSVSPNRKTFSVDLNDHLPSFAVRNPALFPCCFSYGDGKLLVVNEATEPFYVEYSSVEDTITVTDINLKKRDFEGVEDGLDVNERPTSTVADLKTNDPEHYYNLLNQGWYATDALSQWDTARSDLPSNADYIQLYRVDTTDAFADNRVTANSPGNTPAAKGHFILEVGNENRNQAMIDAGFTGATLPTVTPLIAQNLGTPFTSLTINTSVWYDGDTTQSSGECTRQGVAYDFYAGKDYGSSTFQVTKTIVYGSTDSGFFERSPSSGDPNVTITLYGSNVAPVTYQDGDNLGSTTFGDTDNESTGRTINSLDTVTAYRYVWIYVSSSGGSSFRQPFLAELEFYTVDPDVANNRPTQTAFFAGRAWYAGMNIVGLASDIYFSQIIERNDQFEKCYQVNDPTSEHNAELLPSDGGVIRILEMGSVIRLFPTQNSLLVFATNGVWLIGGSSGAGFTANDYVVSRLSSIGTSSPHSFVDVQGIPFWWTESDIYTVQFDPNYNSYAVKPVTTTLIQSFIKEIPSSNRKYVKGTYNLADNCVYWLYNDVTDPDDQYTYTNVLVFDTIAGAFYPWTIGDSDPKVRGILTVQAATSAVDPEVKFTTTIDIDASNEYLTFSECLSESYKDWTVYATDEGSAADEIDYTSYFITGYRIDGQSQRFFQANYIWVFMDTLEDSSCYLQGIWDFTNSNSSGKWSTSQQVYSTALFPSRDVRHRRLKIRGKGKALQLKFESESGKPFSIIGWSILESSNASI